MPFLDVLDAFDTNTVDVFSVYRRNQTVDNYGRAQILPLVINGVYGVVTAAGPNDIKREEDKQYMDKSIVIVTRWRLQGPSPSVTDPVTGQPSPERQPDVIKWGGSYFLIIQLDDYSSYGPGFVQAVARSYDYMDVAPQGDNPENG